MQIGVPKEIKSAEKRVAATPAGVRAFVAHGHKVFVEKGAGLGSGFRDDEYKRAGAVILENARDIWTEAEMIIKVKEPIGPELEWMRPGQIIFTYLHQNGGMGILLSGISGVRPARVTVIGGGVVGYSAAVIAVGMGAQVSILDNNPLRLRYLEDISDFRMVTIMSNPANIEEECVNSHLVIGSVLIPGAKAPKLITRDIVKQMMPGSAIVDVAIDQGGCCETSHPTTHEDPTFIVDDVVHYCVANMPGAVPRTSTIALTNVTLAYALEIANKGYEKALSDDPALKKGLNILNGEVCYPAVAEAFDLPCTNVSF